MFHTPKFRFATLVLTVLMAPEGATAHPGHEELEKLKPRDLTRLVTTPEGNEWQTAVSTLKDGDITVTLIGITHIATPAYRALVQKAANDSEVILFESLGFEGDEKVGRISPVLTQLRQGYQQHAATLGWKVTLPLSFRKDRKAVPVDLDHSQFEKLTPDQRKSVLKDLPEGEFSLKQASRNPERNLAFSGQSAFGDLREDLLVRQLHLQLIQGTKTCAMIVSTSRMPGLELRLRKQKFLIDQTQWLGAWSWSADCVRSLNTNRAAPTIDNGVFFDETHHWCHIFSHVARFRVTDFSPFKPNDSPSL